MKCGVQCRADERNLSTKFLTFDSSKFASLAVKFLGLLMDDKHEIHLNIAHSASESATHDKSEGTE